MSDGHDDDQPTGVGRFTELTQASLDKSISDISIGLDTSLGTSGKLK